VIERLDSSKTPAVVGPYSKATRIVLNNVKELFASGMFGISPITQKN